MRLHDICGRLPQKTTKECLAGEDPEEMESVPTIVAELDAAHERGGTLLAAAALLVAARCCCARPAMSKFIYEAVDPELPFRPGE